MDNKYEVAGNTDQSNAETGWEGVAALADDFQTNKPVAEAEAQQPETISQPEVVLSASNNVYREIAKDALKNWNGLSDEEASEKVNGASVEELESQVYAGDSIKAAVSGIGSALESRGITWQGEEDLLSSVLDGEKQDSSFSTLSECLERVDDKEGFVIDVLSDIHKNWAETNLKKFADEKRRNKQYQFMPLELIGNKEARADLLFLEPILKAGNFGDEHFGEQLDQKYTERQNEFLEKNNLHSFGDVASALQDPENWNNGNNDVIPEWWSKLPDTAVKIGGWIGDTPAGIEEGLRLGKKASAVRIAAQVEQRVPALADNAPVNGENYPWHYDGGDRDTWQTGTMPEWVLGKIHRTCEAYEQNGKVLTKTELRKSVLEEFNYSSGSAICTNAIV